MYLSSFDHVVCDVSELGCRLGKRNVLGSALGEVELTASPQLGEVKLVVLTAGLTWLVAGVGDGGE